MKELNEVNIKTAKVHYKKIDKVDDLITKIHEMLITNKNYSLDEDELFDIIKKVEDLQEDVSDYLMNMDMEIDEYEESNS